MSRFALGDLQRISVLAAMAIRSQPGLNLPEPIDAPQRKRPWRPRVAGVIGFLFGPLAAAIVSFINLRRLGSTRRANWVLLITVLACPLLGAADYLLQEEAELVSRLVGNLISPFLYPALQWTEFQEWEAKGQPGPPSRGWYATGWGILGAVLFLPLYSAGVLPYVLSERVHDIDVQVDAEIPLRPDQAAELQVRITNTGDTPQLLKSIDIDRSLLREFELTATDPPYEKTEPVPFADVQTYYYNAELPPHGELLVTISVTPRTVGRFESALDVCIETDTNCLLVLLEIPVEAAE